MSLRVLIRLSLTIALGLTAAVATASSASAADQECSINYYDFWKSEPKGYMSVDVSAGSLVRATGTVQGWQEAFKSCQDPTWTDQSWYSIKSMKTGKYLTVDYSDGYKIKATSTFVGYREVFTFSYLYTNSNQDNVWSIHHVESGKYLSAASSDSIVRANATFVGWYEAFAGLLGV
jgi:hypothetical protein